MPRRQKPDSVAGSSSAAALVVQNDSTETPQNNRPRREKTRAEKDKHNQQCRESRVRVKEKKLKMEAELMIKEKIIQRMQLKMRRVQQKHKSQTVFYKKTISKMRSRLQAQRRVIQQKEKKNEMLKRMPAKWQRMFKELKEQGIDNVDQLQRYLFSEDAKYKQHAEEKMEATGHDSNPVYPEPAIPAVAGCSDLRNDIKQPFLYEPNDLDSDFLKAMADIERLGQDEPDIQVFNPMYDLVVEPGTIENNTSANDTAAV